MAEEYEEEMNGEENGMTGPGAPTPVMALEVSSSYLSLGSQSTLLKSSV
jgi:hypothetical protein